MRFCSNGLYYVSGAKREVFLRRRSVQVIELHEASTFPLSVAHGLVRGEVVRSEISEQLLCTVVSCFQKFTFGWSTPGNTYSEIISSQKKTTSPYPPSR
jgi:hypothetical protein